MISWLKSKLGLKSLENRIDDLEQRFVRQEKIISKLLDELAKKDKQINYLYALNKELEKQNIDSIQELKNSIFVDRKAPNDDISTQITGEEKGTTSEDRQNKDISEEVSTETKSEYKTSATSEQGLSFIAIDIETANSNPASICSIGIVEVNDGEIVNNEYFLIRPKRLVFNPVNVQIHGLNEDNVKDQPKFNELWHAIKNSIDGRKVVAHNASFDMAALRQALDEYGLKYPSIDYICTKEISKKLLPESKNHKLTTLSKNFEIELDHHDALSDAIACAKIAIAFCRQLNSPCINGLSNKLNVNIKQIRPSDTRYSDTKKRRKSKFPENIRVSDIKPETKHFDEDHPCYYKKFCFTGELKSMERKEAMQTIVNSGGMIGNSMSKSVDYLVVGKDGEGTSKHKTALRYRDEYGILEIIDENTFLEMVGYETD